MKVECPQCQFAERVCSAARQTEHARAVWLAWGEGRSEPACDDYRERERYWRGESRRHGRRWEAGRRVKYGRR